MLLINFSIVYLVESILPILAKIRNQNSPLDLALDDPCTVSTTWRRMLFGVKRLWNPRQSKRSILLIYETIRKLFQSNNPNNGCWFCLKSIDASKWCYGWCYNFVEPLRWDNFCENFFPNRYDRLKIFRIPESHWKVYFSIFIYLNCSTTAAARKVLV